MKGILAILMAGIMVLAMIAPAMGGDPITSATVGNADPTAAIDPIANVQPNPCPNDTTFVVTGEVSDENGEADIVDIDYALMNTSTGDVIDSGFVDAADIVGTGPTTVGFTATITVPCCIPAGEYYVNISVHDSSSNIYWFGPTPVIIASTIAMTASNVVFGNVVPGGNSTNSSTVSCMGNAALVFADLGDANYDNPDDADGISWTNMTSGENTILDDQITTTWVPATTITCDTAGDVPFRLDVPLGTPSGVYAGTVVFTPLV